MKDQQNPSHVSDEELGTTPESMIRFGEHTCAVQLHPRRKSARPLEVIKFGGTSVSDAGCIRRVIEIIRHASIENDLVVVVSAMAGITNKLIEAANHSAARNRREAEGILEEVRHRHEIAIHALIHAGESQALLKRSVAALMDECARWCEVTEVLGQLTARAQDSISSIGERLNAPLIAAALAELDVAAEAIEATELITTDWYYGAADPKMQVTRGRCEARLRPLLQHGIVPVVTGFIGATEEGVLTTLGRGGSDYSATILAASLQADEVTIWTDVNGMFTADPHLVPSATTIPEISYREAAELARFGAKVLHPKTLQPVMQCGIPVWVRNTFAPEKSGTKITPDAHPIDDGVKAVTAVNHAALITVHPSRTQSAPEVVEQMIAATDTVRADLLMISCSPLQDRVDMVVAGGVAERVVAALRGGLNSHLKDGDGDLSVDSTVSLLTVVGQDLLAVDGIVRRAVRELARQNVEILSTAHGASKCNVSFVVHRRDAHSALQVTHREFDASAPEEIVIDRTQAQAL